MSNRSSTITLLAMHSQTINVDDIISQYLHNYKTIKEVES